VKTTTVPAICVNQLFESKAIAAAGDTSSKTTPSRTET
jgi:hypothetical protein